MVQKIAYFALLIFTIGLSACGMIQRSPDSGYAYYGQEARGTFDRQVEKRPADFEDTMTELGYDRQRAQGENESQAINDRILLKHLEEQLSTKTEKAQYFKYKPFMASDRERIDFLRLGSLEARERRAQASNLKAASTRFSPGVAKLIEDNDIALGMTKNAVKESWGEPDVVESAGNPVYGNERWHYVSSSFSTDGFQSEKRLVYFENSRVSGWETNRP